ncbi:MAG TPA: squalene synthase HpnC, partial [Pseudonocardiaceae bacterium]|nr:squalene synthase HpnC [Pseudonocardiaceae bacterium]
RKLRVDLIAVYGFARTVDDLGDEAAGNRTALLEAFRADLASVWETGQCTQLREGAISSSTTWCPRS